MRQDNALGTLFNMVGFQTKLKYGEQARVFRLIPGLQHAEFARLGGLHRNTFLNSPRLLDDRLRLRAAPRLRFAGQITGCEGYVESAAIGLIAGRFAAAERLGVELPPLPSTTAIGALLNHITGGHLETIEAGPRSFQPMNVNFGLFPPIEEPRTDEIGKKAARAGKGRSAKARAVGAGGGGFGGMDFGDGPRIADPDVGLLPMKALRLSGANSVRQGSRNLFGERATEAPERTRIRIVLMREGHSVDVVLGDGDKGAPRRIQTASNNLDFGRFDRVVRFVGSSIADR